jgi:hypothetical protein
MHPTTSCTLQMRALLLEFHKATRGRKPEHLIFFRDGVSEGQFKQVYIVSPFAAFLLHFHPVGSCLLLWSWNGGIGACLVCWVCIWGEWQAGMVAINAWMHGSLV